MYEYTCSICHAPANADAARPYANVVLHALPPVLENTLPAEALPQVLDLCADCTALLVPSCVTAYEPAQPQPAPQETLTILFYFSAHPVARPSDAFIRDMAGTPYAAIWSDGTSD